MTTFEVFKMVISSLIPKDDMIYILGTLVFIFVIAPLLGINGEEESHKSKN